MFNNFVNALLKCFCCFYLLELNSKSSVCMRLSHHCCYVTVLQLAFHWTDAFLQLRNQQKKMAGDQRIIPFYRTAFWRSNKEVFLLFSLLSTKLLPLTFFRWHSFEWSGSSKEVLTRSNSKLTQGLKKWIHFLNHLSYNITSASETIPCYSTLKLAFWEKCV